MILLSSVTSDSTLQLEREKSRYRAGDEQVPGFGIHGRSVAKELLDIQVLHIQRVFFDEFAAGFHVFAHQRGEDGLALGDVFEFHR